MCGDRFNVVTGPQDLREIRFWRVNADFARLGCGFTLRRTAMI